MTDLQTGDIFMLENGRGQPHVLIDMIADDNSVVAIALFEKRSNWENTEGLLLVPTEPDFMKSAGLNKEYVIPAVGRIQFPRSFVGERIGKFSKSFMETIGSFLERIN